jgi:prepilin-type N-terminal cleavage/methylation domain-containing protein
MTPPFRRAVAGITLIELLVVLAIIGTLLAAAMLVLPSAITFAKADSGSTQAVSALRTCREQAITERRNVEIAFDGPNRVVCNRREIDGTGTPTGALTEVQSLLIGERMEFLRFPGIQDTPDGFAAAGGAVDFTGGAPWSFTSEGTLVDVNGDVVNGTVFLGQPQMPQTARAVTLFGATAFLREWRWNGRAWTE